MQKNEYSKFYRYCLIFDSDYLPLITYTKNKLSKVGFTFKEFHNKNDIILLISNSNEENLLREAQYSKIRKIHSFSECKEDEKKILPPQVIKNEKKRVFNYFDRTSFLQDDNYDLLYQSKKNDELWGYGLFTELEMLLIETHVASAVEIDDEFLNLFMKTPLSSEKSYAEKIIAKDRRLLFLLKELNIIKDYLPLHISDIKENILKKAFSLTEKFPSTQIRDYYGDDTAIYYSWVYHYTSMVKYPSAIAAFVIILSLIYPDYKNNLYFIYSIIVLIWGQIYITSWNRRCSELYIEWDNFTGYYERILSSFKYGGIKLNFRFSP